MTLIPQFLLDSLLLGGLYCLMAVGLALAFGVTRIINFAHGEMIMLGVRRLHVRHVRGGRSAP